MHHGRHSCLSLRANTHLQYLPLARLLPSRSAPGERLQAKLGGGDKSGLSEGVTGLRNGPARTGVRELTYRLVFIASGTQVRWLCIAALVSAALVQWLLRACCQPVLSSLHAAACGQHELLWLAACVAGHNNACALAAAHSCPQPLDQKSSMIQHASTSFAHHPLFCLAPASPPAAAGPEERHGEHPRRRRPGAGGRAGPVLAGAAGAVFASEHADVVLVRELLPVVLPQFSLEQRVRLALENGHL